MDIDLQAIWAGIQNNSIGILFGSGMLLCSIAIIIMHGISMGLLCGGGFLLLGALIKGMHDI